MEEFDRVAVENFVLSCNDMLSGKFLDIDRKLASVMNAITKSDDILTFLADAITDYDEEKGFESAFSLDPKTKNGKVLLPQNEKERVALTVTIFNDIQSGKINSTRFLETYFKDGRLAPTQNLLEKIIKPFRDIICKNFGVKEDITKEEIEEHKRLQAERRQEEKANEEVEEFEEQFPEIDNLMIEVKKTAREILSRLKFEKKKKDNLEDFEFILNALITACDSKNLMIINGLIIGINYVSHKYKNVRYLVDDLNNIIYDYYDFLAENSSKNTEKMENFDDFNENFEENENYQDISEDEYEDNDEEE